ncbi:hypothetical protein [Bacillus tuaregi]|uniref:hypothetical protein n=1 Tax=Bacillus tuaregi TaxID=1816695 RepID=UPI0008F7EF91|nr:hypothetical protein [Bacillus tuaregi]
MEKNQLEWKKFLEQQLEWGKQRDRILEQIEKKLFEMKSIAEYAAQHELSKTEAEKLNEQLNVLKDEIHALEECSRHMVH